MRKALVTSFADRQAVLEAFADDANLDAPARMRAIELIGKFGLGTANNVSVSTVSADWIVGELSKVRQIVRDELPHEKADALLHRIAEETFRQ